MRIKDQATQIIPTKMEDPLEGPEDIVITGISGRYPDCDSIVEFWQKLVSGIEFGSIDDRRWPVGEYTLYHSTEKYCDSD
jgi:acyl transferase domain-containing protein